MLLDGKIVLNNILWTKIKDARAYAGIAKRYENVVGTGVQKCQIELT